MAGDWLAVRLDIHEDPAVYKVAKALKIDPDAVVGKLTRMWAWFNTHSADGTAPDMTMDWLDAKMVCPGFGAAVVAAGWLVVDETGLKIPKWEKWNGGGAKARLQTTRRKQTQRAHAEDERPLDAEEPAPVPRAPDAVTLVSRSERDKSVTRGEERREEKKNPPPPPRAPARLQHPNGVVGVVEHSLSLNGERGTVVGKRHTAPPPPIPPPDDGDGAEALAVLRDAGVTHHRRRLAKEHSAETLRAMVAHVGTLKRPPEHVPGLIVKYLDDKLGPEILAEHLHRERTKRRREAEPIIAGLRAELERAKAANPDDHNADTARFETLLKDPANKANKIALVKVWKAEVPEHADMDTDEAKRTAFLRFVWAWVHTGRAAA